MERSPKTKYILNAFFALFVGGLAVFYLTRSGVITREALRQISPTSLLVVAGYTLGCFALLALSEHLVYRTVTPLSYKAAFCNVLYGNLGSNVTPFKCGHFPMMAYYQAQEGIPFSRSLAAITKCQIVFSATSCAVYAILTIALASFGLSVTVAGQPVSLWMVSIIGFTVHLLVVGGLTLLAFTPALQRKIFKLFAILIGRFRKNFDKQAFVNRKSEAAQAYRRQLRILRADFPQILIPAAVYAVCAVAFGSVEYVAYLTVGAASFAWEELFLFYVLHLTAAYVANVIPIPGGVGTSEVLFSLVYAVVIPDRFLGAVLVLWRVGSTYLFVVAEVALFAVRCFFPSRMQRPSVSTRLERRTAEMAKEWSEEEAGGKK